MNRPRHWRDSKAVSALSEHLKAHQAHGISLVLLDRKPALHFEPGLAPSEKDRWAAALEAVGLLAAAAEDLKRLANLQLIRIPAHPGWIKEQADA